MCNRDGRDDRERPGRPELGLLVIQNGEAPEPATTDPVNGFEFDGSTQFMYLNFVDTLRALKW